MTNFYYLCSSIFKEQKTMAAKYYIKTPKPKDTYVTIFVRVQSRKFGIDYRYSTHIEMKKAMWEKMEEKPELIEKYREKEPEVFAKLDKLKQTINTILGGDKAPSKEQVQTVINEVVYADVLKEQAETLAKAKAAEEEAKRMTLAKYIDGFIKSIQNGTRLTEKGTVFTDGSIRTIKTSNKQFQKFQQSKKRTYDFADIDMQFYYDFLAYLKKRDYSINTVGKIINQFKWIMSCAQAEGYHTNTTFKNPKFKGNRVQVDTIYLTQEELDKMNAADLSELEAGAAISRDIFMVGVYTAQRISDYNNIKKEDIHTVTKRWIEDVPDPKKKGQTKAVIKTKDVTYIDIHQKKTGAKVSIPCKKELVAILEKYNYELPHFEDQTINRHIKDIARVAGLTDLVTIETSKGGVRKKETIEKYKLVMSHTARRTGATLMYLAGIDIFDIMKVTGHTTPEMLKRYIKADQLDVVQKLTDKYDYFD